MPDKRFAEDFMDKWQKASDADQDTGEETFICPLCQREIPASADVCPGCGAVFEDGGGAVFECPVCGTEVHEEEAECPKCGAIFSDGEEGEFEEEKEEETELILDELEQFLGLEEEEEWKDETKPEPVPVAAAV
ncbi:MAG: zinc ribbon domain-containing protein, partial [Thermoplasmata archaeon]|nr:zinc ribbon domain-containing protein [Thermoplasmata archaeon]